MNTAMDRGAGFVQPASAVVIAGRALLITGPPGCGKSSLALALIDRGAGLIGDDAVTLTLADDRLIASPPPNIAGFLELRGVGLVRLPVADPAPVALILELGGAAEPARLPETLHRRDIVGVQMPVLAFDPGTIAPGPRAEWALKMHGLVFELASIRAPSGQDAQE